MGRRPLLRIFLPAFLLLFTTCTEWHDMPQTPPRGGSRIYGVVTGGSGPVAGATVVAEGTQTAVRVEAETEADGSYELLVPPGDYFLRTEQGGCGSYLLYSTEGVTSNWRDADTLRFSGGEGEARADFHLGGLLLFLHVFPGEGDDYSYCELQDPISGEGRGSIYGSARDSVVVFDCPMIIPGNYILRVERSWDQYLWLPPTIDRERAEQIDIRAGETVFRSEMLPTPAVVSGRVTGAWTLLDRNRPQVRLYGSSPSFRVAWVDVASDGTFALRLCGGGVVRARLTAQGAEMWLGGSSFDDATPIQILPGADLDLGEIPTCGIRCSLVGFPVPELGEWSVEAYDEQHVPLGNEWIVDASEVVLALSRPTVCRLFITAYDAVAWRPQWYDRVDDFEHATPVTVSGWGEPVEVQVQLKKGGSIAGNLVYQDGSPAVAVRVRLLKEGATIRIKSTVAPDGAFAFAGLPDGEFELRAVTDWGYSYYYPGTESPDSAEAISIADAGDLAGLLFHLPTSDARQLLFVGAASCKPCHQTEAQGGIYNAWLSTAHARAYSHLDAAHQADDLCLACHTTGSARALAPGRDRQEMRGVQCEACHGPGSAYKAASVMEDPVEARWLGLVTPDKDDCVACHRGSLPWECWGGSGASPAFEFESASARIKHEIPD